jgi:hypothetical protein
VKVDVETNGRAVGKTIVFSRGSWDVDSFLMIACGLYGRLSAATKARIAFWAWTEPKEWQTEREEWRSGRRVSVDAGKLDTLREKAGKFDRFAHEVKEQRDALKRTLQTLRECAGSDADEDEEDDENAREPPAKRRRTDEELLAERAEKKKKRAAEKYELDI